MANGISADPVRGHQVWVILLVLVPPPVVLPMGSEKRHLDTFSPCAGILPIRNFHLEGLWVAS